LVNNTGMGEIVNNEGELNISHTQLGEAKLVVKCLLLTKEASTIESKPFQKKKGVLLSP